MDKIEFKLLNKFLILYLFLKILSVFIAYYLNSNLLGNENFFYGDIDEYINCDIRSYNSFFTIFNCFFGINNISNIYIIILAYLISTIKDITFIYLSNKILNKSSLALFVVLIACHPYLAIYHPRFVTGLFANIAFLIIFFMIQNNKNLNFFFLVCFIILTGFRNGLMPIFITFIIFYTYDQKNNIKFSNIIIYLFSIILIYLITKIPKHDYAIALMIDHENVFSWFNIIKFFSLDINILSYVLTFPIVFVSHFVLLLGFREAIFTNGFEDLFNLSFQSNFLLLIFITLFIIHTVGLYYFFYIYRKNIKVWSFLAYFFPSMLFVAHMRYFVPMIPIVILGIALLFQNRIFKKKLDK